MSKAMRFNKNKLRFDLIPPEALIELARVYTVGALKYPPDNWKKGGPWSDNVRAINSHLTQWRAGQAVDKETGAHHLMHLAWNAITLMYYEMYDLGQDDRQKFLVDEKFNWVYNKLGLGKSEEELEELHNKFKQEREKSNDSSSN